MYLVNSTILAEQDIASAVKYIADVLKAPIAVNNLLDEIEKHEEILENTPNMYPFVYDEYLAEKGIKFVMVKQYILFFTVDEDKKEVNVIRFLHSRRDWENILVSSLR